MSLSIAGAWLISPSRLLKWRGCPDTGTTSITLVNHFTGAVINHRIILTASLGTFLSVERLMEMVSSTTPRSRGVPSPTYKSSWKSGLGTQC